MPKNVAAAFASQIEITMLRKIQRRGFVSSGFVVDDQLIFIGQHVTDLDLQVAGDSLPRRPC